MNETTKTAASTGEGGPYLIRSVSERAYWSNSLWWVYDVRSATCFEDAQGNLPLACGKDAEFVRRADACDFDPDAPECVRCTHCGREWLDGQLPQIVINAGTVGESRIEACDHCLTPAHLVDTCNENLQSTGATQ